MSVTLLDLFLSKKLIGFGAFGQHTRIASKTKGSAKVFHIFLTRHQSNDRMRGLRCQLNAVGIFISKYVAGKFYNSHLHSKADAKVRNLMNSRILCCKDHSFSTTVSESSRNQNSIYRMKGLIQVFLIELFRVYPDDINFCTAGDSTMFQGFHNT